MTDQSTASCLAGGEDNLYSNSPFTSTPVGAGDTVSAVYSDESPLGTGSMVAGTGNQTGGPAPAVFLGGVLQPASALRITDVAGAKDNQADATLSYTIPAGTPGRRRRSRSSSSTATGVQASGSRERTPRSSRRAPGH